MRRAAAVMATGACVLAALLIAATVGGSAGSIAAAATPAQQIGMKVLLITDSADARIAYQRLGEHARSAKGCRTTPW